MNTLFYRFGAALAIGLLIGLEREHAASREQEKIFAGVRTFPLLSLAGCTAMLLSETLSSPLPFVAVAALIGLLIAIAYTVGAQRGQIGMTSEVSAVITFLLGAVCYGEYFALAAAITVATMVLLSLKLEMRTLAEKLSQEDIYATLKFAVITAIVLPVLPNRTFGPLDVLNPHKIWLMVIFISGISFLGYFLIKIVGPRRGIGLTGLLGGLASSTAVTLSFSQRSTRETALAKPFAMAIMVAWTVMFARVLVVVSALNRALFNQLWLPLGSAAVIGLCYCGYLFLAQRTHEAGDGATNDTFANPFDLGPAMKFGLIYAGILLVAKAAQVYLGETGIYLSSIVGGLTDVDAITLSLSQLSRSGTGALDLATAARGIVFACISNTIVKGGLVLASGARELRRAMLPGFLAVLGATLAVTLGLG
ncbi:MAG: MgtC family protein [Planctomycetes bacterium ADurb.Bin126]|nr:MAG: MgtC family protein [Planctomycetes bacterium ADurb.Bin126]